MSLHVTTAETHVPPAQLCFQDDCPTERIWSYVCLLGAVPGSFCSLESKGSRLEDR